MTDYFAPCHHYYGVSQMPIPYDHADWPPPTLPCYPAAQQTYQYLLPDQQISEHQRPLGYYYVTYLHLYVRPMLLRIDYDRLGHGLMD